MSRYIDADVLIKEINMNEDLSAYDVVIFEEVIINTSTADVRKVVRGKWIPKEIDYPWGDSTTKVMMYKCSVCGYEQDWEAKFCPSCGADMLKGEKE